MYHPARSLVLALALTLAIGAPAVFAAPTASAESAQPAKWVSRDLTFIYQGFTTQYSCDGLRDNAVTILRALGASKHDFKVKALPCASRGISEISFSPGIHGTIMVLVPATAQEVSSKDPAIVPAHWETVNLMRTRNLDTRRSGNCELLEQAKRELLPLFTFRNLDYSSNCVPHQTSVGGMTFKVDVLQADAKPAER